MSNVSVIGAGAWGTALAQSLAGAGHAVTLYAREAEVVSAINERHENTVFLPDIPLNDSIAATNDLADAVAAELILLVVPSQFLRTTLDALKQANVPGSTPLILCSKGVEKGSLKLMSEVLEETLSNPYGILSGPTFAHEVAKGMPTSVTLASSDAMLLKTARAIIATPSFKIKKSTDVIGAEIGGAMKNVIAIACGIVEGCELGLNAKAALITQGLKEMRRLNKALGGRNKTLMQLCGVGDLVLTCTSQNSRNMSLGYMLGQGRSFEEITAGRTSVAEGFESSASVVALADKHDVQVPVCRAVHNILHGKRDIKQTIQELVEKS